MPRFVADFHIHSRYSRATSKDLTVAELAKWAKLKGIGVLGTGDFTHPLWLQELQDALRETGGLYEHGGVRFMLTTEVNTLFYDQGKARQIHHVLMAPSFEAVDRINRELERFGGLSIDGRPTLRLEAWRLAEIVLGLEPRCVVAPAHFWTPWFGLLGAASGYNAIEECFKHQAGQIFLLETGLSSDPAMSWRLGSLDRYTLMSNSDAHSARRIGREANVFDCDLAYDALISALRAKDPARFLGTLEFFPEEGKYHLDGHRPCKIRLTPAETKRHQFRCPACGAKVTVGVMHRVESLADRPEGTAPARTIPFTRVVQLEKLIADALDVGVGTQAVERAYHQLVHACGTEFDVLLTVPEETLRRSAPQRVAEAILRMREGRVVVEPGYDGEYGTVRVFGDGVPVAAGEEQLTLF